MHCIEFNKNASIRRTQFCMALNSYQNNTFNRAAGGRALIRSEPYRKGDDYEYI